MTAKSVILNPDMVQDFVSLAFCLEAISDKEGCTSRYKDLEGKPLHDFIIAGISSGKYFAKVAADISNKRKVPIFNYFVPAIRDSSKLTSKTVNFGLLEIMFPVVYARMLCEEMEVVIYKIIELMKRDCRDDVVNLIEARKEAWKTSTTQYKKKFSGKEFSTAKSPFEFYMMHLKVSAPSKSDYQWAEHYKNGLPILHFFLDSFSNMKKPILEEIKLSFNSIRKRYPEVKVGIIADMCAAALFLHLSYT